MNGVTEKRACREVEILQTALELLPDTTGLQIVIEAEDVKDMTDNIVHRAASLMRLHAPGISRQFVVEVKSRLTEATLGLVVHQLQLFSQKEMIVANYVDPKIADRLKAMDMPFLDLAGNA